MADSFCCYALWRVYELSLDTNDPLVEATNFALIKVYIMLCGSNFGTDSGSLIHSLSDLSSIRFATSNLHFNFQHCCDACFCCLDVSPYNCLSIFL